MTNVENTLHNFPQKTILLEYKYSVSEELA